MCGGWEGVASGVGAAVLYALSMVLLRQLARDDHAVTTAFLEQPVPGDLFFCRSRSRWAWRTPALTDLPPARTDRADRALPMWFMPASA